MAPSKHIEEHSAHGPKQGWSSPQRRRALGLFVFFFLVIAAFWVQKPIRTSRFLTSAGPQHLPWVKLGTAVLILPAVMLYSAVAARLRRERLVYLCTAVFIVISFLFWGVFTYGSPAWVDYAYFFHVDIFNSVMVVLFWSFANDLSTPDEAQRYYGFVGAGGILGGAVGSSLTGITVERIGVANLLLVCVLLLVAIAFVARWIAGIGSSATAGVGERQPSLADAIAGAQLTWGSRYLTSVALLVALYEIVSNIIDYQFNVVVAARYHDEAAMASFLGLFNSAAIVASMVVQFVATTWILRVWGPRVGLFILPVALGLGSGAFLMLPAFATIAGAFFSDAALSYSLNQSTKEVLYTPTDADSKYQAKAFIDMFLMRFAKGISSLIVLGWIAWIGARAHPTQYLGIVSIVVISAWLLVAYAAGRDFERLKGTKPNTDRPSRAPADPIIEPVPSPEGTLA